MIWGGIPPGPGFALCWEDAGARCCPPGARPSLLSPPQKQNCRGRSEPRHLPAHLLPKNVAAEGHEREAGSQVRGAKEARGSLGVRVPFCHMHEDAVPAGPALSPQEVLRHELRGGGSVLAAQPPSVHAQVREFHLVHRDGVVLGLAVGSCDGSRRARRRPERGEREGGVLRGCFMNFYTASNLPRVPKPWGIAANKPKATPSDPVPSQTPQPRASTQKAPRGGFSAMLGQLPNSPYGDLEDLVEFALQQRRLQHTRRLR